MTKRELPPIYPKELAGQTETSEMVDRVAKAINAAGMAWLAKHMLAKHITMTWDVPDEVFARAAIEAMREPTPEMTKAAWAKYEQGHLKTAWRLMIDEAMK